MEPAIHTGDPDQLREGVVRAAVVDADHLEVIRRQLREQALQRSMELLNRLAFVVTRHDDRDLAPGGDGMTLQGDVLHGAHGFYR